MLRGQIPASGLVIALLLSELAQVVEQIAAWLRDGVSSATAPRPSTT